MEDGDGDPNNTVTLGDSAGCLGIHNDVASHGPQESCRYCDG